MDAGGPGPQVQIWGDALVRAAAGIDAATPRSPWRESYLVGDHEGVLVVYAKHETGLEIVVAGAAIVQAAALL